MSLFRVDCVFPFFTGDPSDVIVNTLHFEEESLSTQEFGESVPVFLNPFFETIYGTTGANRANYIDWPNMKYRTFNLSDPTPRVPWEEFGPWSTAGTAVTTIPTEVASCISFQSQGLPGDVYQRRYNRIFLGGMCPNFLVASETAEFPRFSSAWMTGVTNAMKNLAEDLPGPGTLWVQVSRAGGTVRTLPVIAGWCDNSPDTQRRRSVSATSRVSWDLL
uniref:Uncharacterized protein n=1 Tax=uncultured prokaryote TaxID=198431 RepID=A0A0H5QNF9_9ZZZZ|nr:hypothetical protein [uncultured prokaryote]